MTRPAVTTHTVADIDEATKNELQPPCDVNITSTRRCDAPAAWVITAVCEVAPEPPRTRLCCVTHMSAFVQHGVACKCHRIPVRLVSAEPLR